MQTPENKGLPPEVEREAIIQQNLEKMRIEMARLLLKESMGFTTVKVRGREYPCSWANGYIDEYGEIKTFGNIQNVNPEIVRNNFSFTFQVARCVEDYDLGRSKVRNFKNISPIVDIFCRNKSIKLEQNSEFEKMLKETVEKYNIGGAASFEGLYQILEMLGGLAGSRKFYTSGELIGEIEKARKAKVFLDRVTRRSGLRDKVEELIEKERGNIK